MRIEESLRKGLGCGQDKFFVIGFHKNAGTTIHHLFLKNLLESRHQPNWGFSVGLGKNARGNFWPKFKAFSDGGNREDFERLSSEYPNSLFLLNCRPLKHWIFSRYKHGIEYKPKGDNEWIRQDSKGKYHNFKEAGLYPCDSSVIKSWIVQRQKHHLNVLNHFKNRPEQLIIFNINKGKWLNFVAKECGLQFYDLHSNRRAANFLSKEEKEAFENYFERAMLELKICKSHELNPYIIPGLENAPDELALGSLEAEMRIYI